MSTYTYNGNRLARLSIFVTRSNYSFETIFKIASKSN